MIHKNFFFRLKYCLLTKLKTQMTRHSSLQCLHAFSVKCLLRPLYFVVVQGRQRNVGEKCDARTVQSYFFAHLTYSFVWSSRIPSEKICVQTKPSILSIRAIFLWPWKTVSVSVRYLFYQPVDGRKDQSMDSSFSHQRETQYGGSIVRLANRFAVWRQSEVSVDF